MFLPCQLLYHQKWKIGISFASRVGGGALTHCVLTIAKRVLTCSSFDKGALQY